MSANGLRCRHCAQTNAGIDDGFGCKTMEIAIFEAKDIAGAPGEEIHWSDGLSVRSPNVKGWLKLIRRGIATKLCASRYTMAVRDVAHVERSVADLHRGGHRRGRGDAVVAGALTGARRPSP
jgi:hypothetical protein